MGPERRFDEAMTSELADLALDAWHSAQPRNGRPDETPSGYVGYGQSYKTQGAKLAGAVDPRSRMSAYFGGAVGVTMNESKPLASKMKLGRVTVSLSELFTPS